MRLLVVEDEKDVANALHIGLSRDGYAVDVAENGNKALEALAVNDYDLLVLSKIFFNSFAFIFHPFKFFLNIYSV